MSGKGIQMLLMKVSTDFNLIWEQTYGSTELDKARAVVQTRDGGYAIFGTSNDNANNSTMCLIKTNGLGEVR